MAQDAALARRLWDVSARLQLDVGLRIDRRRILQFQISNLKSSRML